MNEKNNSLPNYFRWPIYGLLIAVSVGAMAARVMDVRSASRADPSPFLSANDRSRWATIRALVDHGTYAIDDVIFKENGERNRAWHTIDLVYHRDSSGQWHYYSSKPTLLPTLLAAQYGVIKLTTGETLAKNPFYVARLMLLISHVLPLGLALVALAWLVEKYGTTDWGRLFVVAAACGGTYLTTFAVALNNHLPAAVSVTFMLACLLPICWQRQENSWRFLGAGLFAAFAASCELPALAFFAVVAGVLFQQAPRQTIVWFLPPAIVVGLAAVGTNYLAHGTWRPPYAFRKDGPVIAELKLPETKMKAGEVPAMLADGPLSPELVSMLEAAGQKLPPDATITKSATENRWVLWDHHAQERYALVLKDEEMKLHEWRNWYDFPGSYWSSGKLQGVDRGEKSVAMYALQFLAGHHGLFSLTPLWLLTIAGLWIAATGRDPDWRSLACAVILVSVVVIGFYLSRPQIDRNYGGVTCCLRWLLWLAPLWLLAMLPAADAASHSRRACWACLICLAISAFSATYSASNPFSHPWIFEYWQYLGWIRY